MNKLAYIWILTAIFVLPFGLTGKVYSQNANAQVRFDEHKIVRVMINNDSELNTILSISPDILSDRYGVGGKLDCRILPGDLVKLDNAGLNYIVLTDNLQTLIDQERQSLENNQTDALWFENYKTYAEVNDYIDQLIALRPDLASKVNLGTSVEGRSIYGLRITSPEGPTDKPAMFIHGCQHAREWISVMVPMFVADHLLRNYDTDADVRRVVNRVEFIIIPILNPDGYVYSWTTNRMWRKNRRNNGGGSYGVDLNRNWEYGWGRSGSSGSKDSEIYRGPSPFSEPETTAARDFINAHPQISTHIDFHSYSQLVLYPWDAYSNDPPDKDALDYLCRNMASAIKSVHDQNYRVMMGYDLYPAAGTAMDWTYGTKTIFGFTIELRDTGWRGFLLPADQIIPNGEEIVPAVQALADAMSQLKLESDMLYAGQPAEMRVSNAHANEAVYFLYSVTGTGTLYIEPLDVNLDIIRPVLIKSVIADNSGYASIKPTIPPGTPLILVWLQAAQYQNVSNLIITQVNH